MKFISQAEEVFRLLRTKDVFSKTVPIDGTGSIFKVPLLLLPILLLPTLLLFKVPEAKQKMCLMKY